MPFGYLHAMQSVLRTLYLLCQALCAVLKWRVREVFISDDAKVFLLQCLPLQQKSSATLVMLICKKV